MTPIISLNGLDSRDQHVSGDKFSGAMNFLNKGYLYLTLTILIFGPFEVISKLVYGIDAIQLNFLRFLIGGVALLPFAIHDIRRRQVVIRSRDLLHMIGLGVLYIPISMRNILPLLYLGVLGSGITFVSYF